MEIATLYAIGFDRPMTWRRRFWQAFGVVCGRISYAAEDLGGLASARTGCSGCAAKLNEPHERGCPALAEGER